MVILVLWIPFILLCVIFVALFVYHNNIVEDFLILQRLHKCRGCIDQAYKCEDLCTKSSKCRVLNDLSNPAHRINSGNSFSTKAEKRKLKICSASYLTNNISQNFKEHVDKTVSVGKYFEEEVKILNSDCDYVDNLSSRTGIQIFSDNHQDQSKFALPVAPVVLSSRYSTIKRDYEDLIRNSSESSSTTCYNLSNVKRLLNNSNHAMSNFSYDCNNILLKESAEKFMLSSENNIEESLTNTLSPVTNVDNQFSTDSNSDNDWEIIDLVEGQTFDSKISAASSSIDSDICHLQDSEVLKNKPNAFINSSTSRPNKGIYFNLHGSKNIHQTDEPNYSNFVSASTGAIPKIKKPVMKDLLKKTRGTFLKVKNKFAKQTIRQSNLSIEDGNFSAEDPNFFKNKKYGVVNKGGPNKEEKDCMHSFIHNSNRSGSKLLLPSHIKQPICFKDRSKMHFDFQVNQAQSMINISKDKYDHPCDLIINSYCYKTKPTLGRVSKNQNNDDIISSDPSRPEEMASSSDWFSNEPNISSEKHKSILCKSMISSDPFASKIMSDPLISQSKESTWNLISGSWGKSRLPSKQTFDKQEISLFFENKNKNMVLTIPLIYPMSYLNNPNYSLITEYLNHQSVPWIDWPNWKTVKNAISSNTNSIIDNMLKEFNRASQEKNTSNQLSKTENITPTESDSFNQKCDSIQERINKIQSMLKKVNAEQTCQNNCDTDNYFQKNDWGFNKARFKSIFQSIFTRNSELSSHQNELPNSDDNHNTQESSEVPIPEGDSDRSSRSLEPLSNFELCKGCNDHFANSVYFPCGHSFLCFDCALELSKMCKKCSLCFEDIDSVQHLGN